MNGAENTARGPEHDRKREPQDPDPGSGAGAGLERRQKALEQSRANRAALMRWLDEIRKDTQNGEPH